MVSIANRIGARQKVVAGRLSDKVAHMTLTAISRSQLPDPSMVLGEERRNRGSGGTHEHRYSATGEVTVPVPLAGAEEVDAAVRAARTAFPGWRALPGNERRRLLLRLADLIDADADQLSMLTTLENGTPTSTAAAAPPTTAEKFRYNAGSADRIEGAVIPTWPGEALDYAVAEPYGVIAVIIPWNGPLLMAGSVLGPALAAGNCVVVKPPELAPFTAVRLAELALEAGIPPGVVNMLPGGPEAGRALVGHRGVNKIHFTGSGPTAKLILEVAARNLTPVALELGGKSANIVFEDVRVADVVSSVVSGAVALSGQGCLNGTRILVHESIYADVVDAAVQRLRALPMGDPLLSSTVMGPVVNEAACTRILGMIDIARSDGARLATGGGRLGGDYASGYFVEPTILADVDPNSMIARHEVFGPVLAMTAFRDDEEAVRLANATDYGLAAYLQTNDLRRAHRVAERLEAGNVWVNGFRGIPTSVPFGGTKGSGYGRIGGKWGIAEFTQPKNVWIDL